VGEKKFVFEHIPYDERNYADTELIAALDGEGNLSVEKYACTVGGLQQAQFRQLRSIDTKKWPIVASGIVNSLHPNGQLKKFEFNNVNDLAGIVNVSFILDIPEFCTKAGDLYFMQLLDVRHAMTPDATPKERLNGDIDLGSAIQATHRAEYRIPKDFKVYYTPAPIRIDTDNYLYATTLEQKDGSLFFTETYRIKNPLIRREEYGAYQRFRKAMADFSEEYVILEKIHEDSKPTGK
jgi:hypothetical protein